jgi:hypothetical protein
LKRKRSVRGKEKGRNGRTHSEATALELADGRVLVSVDEEGPVDRETSDTVERLGRAVFERALLVVAASEILLDRSETVIERVLDGEGMAPEEDREAEAENVEGRDAVEGTLCSEKKVS